MGKKRFQATLIAATSLVVALSFLLHTGPVQVPFVSSFILLFNCTLSPTFYFVFNRDLRNKSLRLLGMKSQADTTTVRPIDPTHSTKETKA